MVSADRGAALGHLLLDRSSIALDLAQFDNKTVMITGAGGSIGGALAKRLEHSLAKLILVDHSEVGLYHAHKALHGRGTTILCDIRNYEALDEVFTAYQPHIVLHAAALKHVPMLEIAHNVMEAMTTNIDGTDNVLACAGYHKAEKVVVISTDKAVNPSSILGLTKRAAELITAHYSDSRLYPATQYSVVRFGNVVNSAGSAVPLFREQIAAGGPVTITHHAMTRYMMTLTDAVTLVLGSLSLDYEPRSLFVLDMGEPIRIIDLATMLIKLADKEPGVDICIKEIGIRPGEKLSEELFYPDEAPKPSTVIPGVMAGTIQLDPELSQTLLKLKVAVPLRHREAALRLLKELVPTYTGDYRV